MKVPTSVEQEILFKACLGYKKIQMCEEDKEDDMFKDWLTKTTLNSSKIMVNLSCYDVNQTAENTVQ